MNVTFTRDSINMGDDVDAPHYADVDVPDDATWGQLLEAINATRYHHIADSVWKVCEQTNDGPILAVVKYDDLYYVAPPETPAAGLFTGKWKSLHFSTTYGEPGAIWDALVAGK